MCQIPYVIPDVFISSSITVSVPDIITCTPLHKRSPLHPCQHLLPGQRKVVSRFVSYQLTPFYLLIWPTSRHSIKRFKPSQFQTRDSRERIPNPRGKPVGFSGRQWTWSIRRVRQLFPLHNTPNLSHSHGHRPTTYGPFDYFGEFGSMITALQADPKIGSNRNLNLIGPSISGQWTPEMVWNTGFISSYTANIYALAVEQYVVILSESTVAHVL